MMAKIAILVDYYDCGEAIALFIEVWLVHLKKTPLPTRNTRDWVLWIWIAWVFDVEDVFKRATVVFARQSTAPPSTFDLPIPAKIAGKFPPSEVLKPVANSSTRGNRLQAPSGHRICHQGTVLIAG
jgi:hypothetical protein